MNCKECGSELNLEQQVEYLIKEVKELKKQQQIAELSSTHTIDPFGIDWEIGIVQENNAQKCLNRLTKELLGKNYYIVDSVGGNQSNEIIVERIIELYATKKSS